MIERLELYRCKPPEGLRVPILVSPTKVEDGVPEEAEIAQAVRGIKERGGVGGPAGMRVETLRDSCGRPRGRRTQ